MNDLLNLLGTIRYEAVNILGENLIGLYIHGSIAYGCFRWEVSDVDLLIVVRTALSLPQKRELMKCVVALHAISPPKGLEMSVVLEEYCREFVYPTPFDLHFSPMYLAQYEENPDAFCETMHGFDRDLAAHFVTVQSSGMVLWGESIEKVFSELDRDFFLDSILRDAEEAAERLVDNPVYAVLNLCRAAAFVRDGQIFSKLDGGMWGLENLPKRYCELIGAAVDWHAEGGPSLISLWDNESEHALAVEFCSSVIAMLNDRPGS